MRTRLPHDQRSGLAGSCGSPAHPDMCLGLHLTLIQGRAVLPQRTIPHLVDSQGNFRRQPVGAGFTYFFSRRAQENIRAELEAQVEKMLAAGVRACFLMAT